MFNFWSVCVNFGEVGFDSPTKLVPGGPRFLVDPTLRHCTFSHGLDLGLRDRQALHRPHGSLAVHLKYKKTDLTRVLACLSIERGFAGLQAIVG